MTPKGRIAVALSGLVPRVRFAVVSASGLVLAAAVSASPARAQDRASVTSQLRRWQQDVIRNPRDYETLAAIGAAFGKLGAPDSAIVYFLKAIAVNDRYAGAYTGLAAAYGTLRRSDDQLAALTRASALDPANPVTHAQLGTALGKTGQYRQAVIELNKAIKLRPDFADAHFALGLAFVSLGDRSNALAQASELARLDKQLSAQLRALVNQSP